MCMYEIEWLQSRQGKNQGFSSLPAGPCEKIKKNPKTKVLPLTREKMCVIKEYYGVCFPAIHFHN